MSTTSTPVPIILKKSVGWSITLSVLMIVAGILGILVPPAAGMVATVFFGWLLVFCGIAHLVFAWHTRTTGTVIWELLIRYCVHSRRRLPLAEPPRRPGVTNARASALSVRGGNPGIHFGVSTSWNDRLRLVFF
jgi:predicted anti-sigma-YlaC factor YlaD